MSEANNWTACHRCDRGGNGNAEHKCAAGWNRTKPSDLGCYCGMPIVGEPRRQPKMTRSQERYQRFLEFGDCFDSFRDFLSWDAAPERSWNRGM